MRVGKIVVECCVWLFSETGGLLSDADGGVEISQSLFDRRLAP